MKAVFASCPFLSPRASVFFSCSFQISISPVFFVVSMLLVRPSALPPQVKLKRSDKTATRRCYFWLLVFVASSYTLPQEIDNTKTSLALSIGLCLLTAGGEREPERTAGRRNKTLPRWVVTSSWSIRLPVVFRRVPTPPPHRRVLLATCHRRGRREERRGKKNALVCAGAVRHVRRKT